MPDEYVRKIKIMISSTRADLFIYRKEASKIIQKIAEEKKKHTQLVEVSMEKETQTGLREHSLDISLKWVEEADWIVLIVGFNYGSISNDSQNNPEGLSFTEWEYKRAEDENKKIFVFLAGDLDTDDEYRVSQKNEKDLKNWIGKQSNDQKEKLEKFKEQLRQRSFKFFNDLSNFSKELEDTLKEAVDKLPPSIGPKTELAKLIVSVSKNIEKCIDKVTLIATSKRIHDCLHELLQQFISPLWEELLSKWKEETTLSDSRKMAILRLLSKATKQEGKMENLIREQNIDTQKQHALSNLVEKVIEKINQWQINWNDDAFSQSSGQFEEDLDLFEEAVKHAFRQADENMRTEESNLRVNYTDLRTHLEKARNEKGLTDSDHEKLDQELEKVQEKSKKLEHTLITHHDWQEAYEKLRDLDKNRGTSIFSRELKKYCDNYLPKLCDLVDKEIDLELNGTPERKEKASGTEKISSSKSSGIQDNACSIYVDKMKKLKKTIDDLKEDCINEDSTDDFFQEKIKENMIIMRKLFDDSFYCIDKKTLEEVNNGMSWVHALKEWLDKLNEAQLKDDGI